MSVDPILLEVLTHRLDQLATEAGDAQLHVSASPIAVEALDIATGILLADGAGVTSGQYGQSVHIFTGGVESIFKLCSDNPGIEEDDMFILNDPWLGPRHQPDFMLLAPVHHEGKLVAWAGSLAHHLDTGAMTPGGYVPGARDAYQEGLRIPPVKLVEGGRLRNDILNMLLNMVRAREKCALDYKGQIAGCNVLKARLKELFSKYGLETVLSIMRVNIERTEQLLRDRLRELPNGVFKEIMYLDTDCHDTRLYRYAVTMTKHDDELTIDFTGTGEQAPGPVNATLSNTILYLSRMIRTAFCPELQQNQGILNPIKIIAPEGTLVNPKPPAAISMAAQVHRCAIASCLSKLLSCDERYRRRVMSIWHDIATSKVMFSGKNQFGENFSYTVMDNMAAGSGATAFRDGVDSGGTYTPLLSIPNVEFHEKDNPMLFIFRREAADSGGGGLYRGGVTIEEMWVPYGASEVNLFIASRGNEIPTHIGIFGGLPGSCNLNILVSGVTIAEAVVGHNRTRLMDEYKDKARALPSGVPGLKLRPGDALYSRYMGGGGYADPLDREPESVLHDIVQGKVTVEAASQVYGVVPVPSLEEVDKPATDALRWRKRQERLSVAKAKTSSSVKGTQSQGELMFRLGEYLEVAKGDANRIRCRRCKHVFCHAEENPKEFAIIAEKGLSACGPLFEDTSLCIFREFYCPSCATMFATEIIESGLPPIDDVRIEVR